MDGRATATFVEPVRWPHLALLDWYAIDAEPLTNSRVSIVDRPTLRHHHLSLLSFAPLPTLTTLVIGTKSEVGTRLHREHGGFISSRMSSTRHPDTPTRYAQPRPYPERPSVRPAPRPCTHLAG
jgi:hypothetical protein